MKYHTLSPSASRADDYSTKKKTRKKLLTPRVYIYILFSPSLLVSSNCGNDKATIFSSEIKISIFLRFLNLLEFLGVYHLHKDNSS